jgi:Reverse transcriptase (RNA-dependent DNA polymerase)
MARYGEFAYLCYLDLEDPFLCNYVAFHLEQAEPIFVNRLQSHLGFWINLNTPQWLLEYIDTGIQILFERYPPRMCYRNHCTVTTLVVRNIINEYLAYGFIEKVTELPYCILPLQLKETSDKVALIYDMSKLIDFVLQSKFKLESWPEMVLYANSCEYAIKFDMKKFYHQVKVHVDYRQYFGFQFDMGGGTKQYFVWCTMPYGYTRAPCLARQLMKPLIAKWRALGAKTVVFYDDGMAVDTCPVKLQKMSVQMQCDLLRAGLVPGVKKCTWDPVRCLDWNGLTFDFNRKGIAIKANRIQKTIDNIDALVLAWPKVSFRDVARCVGRLNSMYPVLGEKLQIQTKMLQTVVNVRNFKNCAWDSPISLDYVPLYFHAYDELLYWRSNLVLKNFKPFTDPQPAWVGWADASDIAVGGCLIQLKPGQVVVPCTADNIMLRPDLGYEAIRCRASLQADLLPWSHTGTIFVRDELDVNVSSTVEVLLCHRNFTPSESATRERAVGNLLLCCYFWFETSG